MVTRVSQQLISGPTLTATWGITYYIWSYFDGYPSESLLKDGGSLIVTAQSSAYIVPLS